jgi:anti-sigma factor RsiW
MSDERHGTTEELLAVRDGEGSAWAKAHVQACAACRAELYRLEQVRARLRALPSYAPSRDRWAVVAERARRERRQRRWSAAVGLAAAAALGGLLLVAVQGTHPDRLEAETTLRSAMERSQAMEQVLKGVDPDARALDGAAAGAVIALQRQLEAIDARLGDPAQWQSDPGRQAQLWNERAGILSALVDVHTTHVAYAGL